MRYEINIIKQVLERELSGHKESCFENNIAGYLVDLLKLIGEGGAAASAISVELDSICPTSKCNVTFVDSALDALVRLGEDAQTVLIRMLHSEKMGYYLPKVASALERTGWTPGLDETAVKYWLAKNNENKCLEIGESMVDTILSFAKQDMLHSDVKKASFRTLGRMDDPRATDGLVDLLAQNYSSETRIEIMEALLKKPETRALDSLAVQLSRDLDRVIFNQIIYKLESTNWKPGKPEAGAIYWGAKRQWVKCLEMGRPALKALLRFRPDRDDIETACETLIERDFNTGVDAFHTLLGYNESETKRLESVVQSEEMRWGKSTFPDYALRDNALSGIEDINKMTSRIYKKISLYQENAAQNK